METNLLETGLETTSLENPSHTGDDGLNPRQRKFADHYLEGHFGCRAAILAGYSRDNASRIATRLLRNPAIVAYLADERDRLSNEHFYSRRLLIDWLWRAVHTSIDDIAKGDNLIQEQTTRQDSKGNQTQRVKLVNKLAAFRQLARMLGFDQPELCLPGKLSGAFKAFQPANSGVAPTSSGRDRSPGAPLQAGTVIPNGPVGAAHPTPHGHGPDDSHHTSHPTPHDQGPEKHPQTPPIPSTGPFPPNPQIPSKSTPITHSPSKQIPRKTSNIPPTSNSKKVDISGHSSAPNRTSKYRKSHRPRKKKARK